MQGLLVASALLAQTVMKVGNYLAELWGWERVIWSDEVCSCESADQEQRLMPTGQTKGQLLEGYRVCCARDKLCTSCRICHQVAVRATLVGQRSTLQLNLRQLSSKVGQLKGEGNGGFKYPEQGSPLARLHQSSGDPCHARHSSLSVHERIYNFPA